MKTIIKYYDNGNIEEEYTLKDGLMDGISKIWYATGQILSEVNYTNGKLEGIAKNWYETGQILSEVNYTNGKLEGLSKIWYATGKILSEVNYTNGKLEGLWKEWDEHGELTETLYNNGIEVTHVPVYNIVQKHTEEECLIYKTQIDPGCKYLMCSNKEDHVMNYEFMVGFGRTNNLENIKCVYCSHRVKEEVYEQV